MKKEDMIKIVQRMFNEISAESGYDYGFNEMDQTQTDFTLSTKFLNQVSIEGLKMLMELVEKCSHSEINRKRKLSDDEIEENLLKYRSE